MGGVKSSVSAGAIAGAVATMALAAVSYAGWKIAGLPFDVAETVLRGDPHTGSFAIFHLREDGVVQAVEAVNAPADFMGGRQMIAGRKRPTAETLRDVSHSMHELAASG